ncbi:hypothetical protein J2X19_002315 [Rhodoferax ferrireducens]|uniref:Uncharacterized protein n=1 Tax=Rhodoferax ferrireducens TaxID=192843 RepID=A0ABU2C8I0_9BURK|nr:hypothetical protein [Rhodoferax ferrireducens]
MQLTSETLLQVYGWGFASVLFMWSIGYAAGLVISMVRKL